MTSAALAGSTGLVGGNILSTLLTRPTIDTLYAFARRDLPNSNTASKLHPLISSDSGTWTSLYPHSTTLFISALGTTRGQAGSFANQYKIDHDLNLDLAKAAKAAGVRTYVLISTSGANSKSWFPYMKMKGELEDEVKDLGFDHCVIVRPGLIVGDRNDSRPPEFVFRKVANACGALSSGLKDFWAQDATVIARAAVAAGLTCEEGKREKGVWTLSQADVLRLGRQEWKE